MDGISLHTATEKLMARQVEELEKQSFALMRIAKALEQKKADSPAGETVLREGLPPQVESLPLDVPGREALVAAGYTSLAQLPKSGKDLEKIKGIGRVTANQILTYLKTK